MAISRKTKTDASQAGTAAPEEAGKAGEGTTGVRGPSPDPATNLILADIALRGGSMLVRQGLERGFLGAKYTPEKARQMLKGRTMGEALIGTALAKLATMSVPGAILVGGGLLAKTLYDRRRAAPAEDEGKNDLEEIAEDDVERENDRSQG